MSTEVLGLALSIAGDGSPAALFLSAASVLLGAGSFVQVTGHGLLSSQGSFSS